MQQCRLTDFLMKVDSRPLRGNLYNHLIRRFKDEALGNRTYTCNIDAGARMHSPPMTEFHDVENNVKKCWLQGF